MSCCAGLTCTRPGEYAYALDFNMRVWLCSEHAHRILRLRLLRALLFRARDTKPEQTPGSAPQTGHSGARTRRTRAAPDGREPTR